MFINQTMYYLGTGPTVRTFAVYHRIVLPYFENGGWLLFKLYYH